MNKYDDPFKNIWEVKYYHYISLPYDKGDEYTFYLYGTKEQVSDYIKSVIFYGNKVIIDLTEKKSYEIETDYLELLNKDSFRIVGKQYVYKNEMNISYQEHHEYTATPTTLDNIIITL